MRCYDTCCRPERDGENAVVLTTWRTARAERTCGTCGGVIKAGEQYARHFFPPETDGGTSLTVTEHASSYTCWTVMNQEGEE
jgi:hypothetical protein